MISYLSQRRPAWRLAIFLLLLLAGCRLAAPTAAPTLAATINIAQEANLQTTTKVEVLALHQDGQGDYSPAATLTDPAVITTIVTALDQPLPLTAAIRCIDQYRLRFTLADGVVHEFGYRCEGGESFLQGGPGFLQGHAVQPPPILWETVRPFVETK